VSGSGLLCSVHGQPVLPSGGGGKSFKVGQRKDLSDNFATLCIYQIRSLQTTMNL
jgi:hypothetical protein